MADIRDAWTFEPLRPRFPTALQRHLDERLERLRIGAADRVVCVSEPAAADLRSRGIADPTVIANAWDHDQDPGPEAVEAAAGLLAADRTSLLHRLVRKLRPRPRRWPRDWRGWRRAHRSWPGSSRSRSPGRCSRASGSCSSAGSSSRPRSACSARCRVRLRWRCSDAADALLLLAQPARSQLVNFKLFEYLAADVPILALTAGTEAGRIAADAGVRPIVRADDPEAIATALRQLLDGRLDGPDPEATGRYAYPATAMEMEVALMAAIGDD